MGVRGLFSLLENHSQILLHDFQFSSSRLVIDGSNLLYLLHDNSGLDQNHGGEYAALEALLERFVVALRACSISPYFLLDGCSDPSDRKLQTTILRAKDKIKSAHKAALFGKKTNVLPPLALEVLKQTMTRLKVPLAQCYREADQEIAALATEWRCPVLSSDSDFCIFQLPGGMLPIKHFLWEEVDSKNGMSFVPCKIYYASCFCKYFQLRPELLPAFATLTGNDYLKLDLDRSQIHPSDGCPMKGLLHWLQKFHKPDDALEEVLGLLGEESNHNLRNIMTMTVMGYQAPASVMKTFFLHGDAPQLPHTEQGLIPDWMRLPLTQGWLRREVLDVLVLQRRSLSCAVENTDLPSSNLASRPLRQLMYGLLLGGGRELFVTERDRVGNQVKFFKVAPTVTSDTRNLTLASLHQADLSVRLQVLLGALGVTEASLDEVSPQLRLPVAVTCYWLHYAQPTPDKTLLSALVQVMMGKERAGAASLLTNTPDTDAAHVLNQWQLCLQDAISLNQLLNFPLQEPRVSRLFQGTLVHQLLNSGVQQDHPLPAVVCSAARDAWSVQSTGRWLQDEEEEAERHCFAQGQELEKLKEQLRVKRRHTKKQRSKHHSPAFMLFFS